MSFTVDRDELPATLQAIEEAVKELGGEGYTYDDDVAKVSVVGLGMATQKGVAGTMFRSLAEKGINIQMITTSEIKISVLVDRQYAQDALRTVHEAFQLHKPPEDGVGTRRRSSGSSQDRCRETGQTIGTRRPVGADGKTDYRQYHLGPDPVADHVRGPARHARPGCTNVRRIGRGGHSGRHDRAEHRPRESG